MVQWGIEKRAKYQGHNSPIDTSGLEGTRLRRSHTRHEQDAKKNTHISANAGALLPVRHQAGRACRRLRRSNAVTNRNRVRGGTPSTLVNPGATTTRAPGAHGAARQPCSTVCSSAWVAPGGRAGSLAGRVGPNNSPQALKSLFLRDAQKNLRTG